jgi:hypothetical protein
MLAIRFYIALGKVCMRSARDMGLRVGTPVVCYCGLGTSASGSTTALLTIMYRILDGLLGPQCATASGRKDTLF